MRIYHATIVALALACGPANAQQPAPPGMGPAAAAAKRFPQPVRVGTLVGRRVLEPVESQPTLGFVDSVVRLTDAQVAVVVAYGGLLGIGSRRIAVPIDAMVLLGPYMEIVDLTPGQLDHLQTFDGVGATPLQQGDIIRVGLARPSH